MCVRCNESPGQLVLHVITKRGSGGAAVDPTVQRSNCQHDVEQEGGEREIGEMREPRVREVLIGVTGGERKRSGCVTEEGFHPELHMFTSTFTCVGVESSKHR